LDLVFIGAFAESLDFLAGDFFRLAVFAVCALVAAGCFLFAAVVVFFLIVGPALTLAWDFDFALLVADFAFAVAFVAAALALAVALAALRPAAPAFVFGAALLVVLPAVRRAGAVRLLADFFAWAFFAGAFFVAALPAALRVGACFLRALLVALAVAFVAALVRAFLDVFAPDFAAMMCLWFLTCGSRPTNL